MSKKKLIAGNWKMNGSIATNDALVRAIVAGMTKIRGDAGPPQGAAAPLGGSDDAQRGAWGTASCTVAVCVAAPYLAQLQLLRHGSALELGAQDVSAHEQGAYTGEVSATMLKEFGARYAIVGHSERRQYHGETDQLVADKAKAALAHGITPIVCVGETLAEREAGRTEEVVKRQLAAVIHTNGHCISEIVVAYEPVWAIGTGKTATPEQAQQVHAVLRAQLQAATPQAERIAILYGGSMNAANAASLLAQPDIDGGLIGGASLKAPDFLQIIAAAA